MKKLTAFILALVMALVFSACGSSPSEASGGSGSSPSTEISGSTSLSSSLPDGYDSSSEPLDFVMPAEGETGLSGYFADNGLRINLPYFWYGRFTIEENAFSDTDEASSLDLRIGADGPVMFTVYSFLNGYYDALSGERKAEYGEYLGANEQVSFSAVTYQYANPFGSGGKDAEVFNSMQETVRWLKDFVSISHAAAGDFQPTYGISSLILTGGSSVYDLEQYAFPDDPTAAMLAAQVERTFTFDGNSGLSAFDGAANAVQSELLAAALYHTPSLIDAEQNGDRVSAAADAAAAGGLLPLYYYYGEDVRQVASRLFADASGLTMEDCGPYSYLPEQDMYVRRGDYGGPVYPSAQVIAYKQTADGYTCDVIVADTVDTAWVTDAAGNEVTLSRDNILEAAASQQQFRYTFAEIDGILRLDGFTIL